eukprot:2127908-Pyramimonas_sp.AAC.1
MNVMGICGLCLKVALTIGAESVFKSISNKDLNKLTECTLLGHIRWVRQMMDRGIIRSMQWCGTWDMTAGGHTRGNIDRDLLLEVKAGTQVLQTRAEYLCALQGLDIKACAWLSMSWRNANSLRGVTPE